MQFSYAFQPIVDVENKKVFSYEALVRGKNNESAATIFSQIKPDDLPEFDQIARNEAARMAALLGVTCCLNLNFIPACLQNSNKYIVETKNAFIKHHLSLSQMVIEVTEESIIHNQQEFSQRINECRSDGIKTAIDDFGAGYSGLNLLVNFQPDIIKLDMQLIKNIASHGPRQAVVKAIIQVCIALGIDIIAEGVETLDEYFWLKDAGINLFQGYLFARPGFESLPTVFIPEDNKR